MVHRVLLGPPASQVAQVHKVYKDLPEIEAFRVFLVKGGIQVHRVSKALMDLLAQLELKEAVALMGYKEELDQQVNKEPLEIQDSLAVQVHLEIPARLGQPDKLAQLVSQDLLGLMGLQVHKEILVCRDW